MGCLNPTYRSSPGIYIRLPLFSLLFFTKYSSSKSSVRDRLFLAKCWTTGFRWLISPFFCESCSPAFTGIMGCHGMSRLMKLLGCNLTSPQPAHVYLKSSTFTGSRSESHCLTYYNYSILFYSILGSKRNLQGTSLCHW